MLKPIDVAKICHEANKAYCEAHGDKSQKPWDKAPAWQKDSALDGVQFCLANPDAPTSANHDNWMARKLAEGWTHGAEKDAEQKTHPCLVPFGELPVHQRFKDKLFKWIVVGLRDFVDMNPQPAPTPAAEQPASGADGGGPANPAVT